MKKSSAAFLSVLLINSSLFAFEWPIENLSEDAVKSYFGQNKGGLISSSMTFSEQTEVHNVENGHVLLVIKNDEDEGDFFPSALGSSVIIAHNDNLISVYANLDDQSMNINSLSISKGTVIANTGNTAWQSSQNGLEFQILDNKKNAAINPKVLMNRVENENPLTLTKIQLQNKEGNFINLNEVKSFPSGVYRIYEKRNSITVPYKTNILINGEAVDQISFDTIRQENNKIYISGKKKYTSSDVYPDDELLLLGEVMFTRGKATLGINVTDFLNNTKQITYNVQSY